MHVKIIGKFLKGYIQRRVQFKKHVKKMFLLFDLLTLLLNHYITASHT